MAYKLGLHPPTPGQIPLRLATYLHLPQLPTPPEEFGHYSLIPPGSWGMLANDEVGDCAIAGACHQTMLWTKEGGGIAAPFDDNTAVGNYSAITGYNPADPTTDRGTGISQLAAYWLVNGIVDDNGTRHKVVAVADLNPGDLRELWVATYLFQSVGLGFAMPDTAMDQTERGEPWDVESDYQIVGGHYVPCVGRKAGFGVGVTWGQLQPFTPAFYQQFNNQGIVALSEEMMENAKSIDGFDDKTLRDDIRALNLT